MYINIINIEICQLLEVREERRESRNAKPIISQFYQRLNEYKQQAEQLRVQYLKMYTSLKYAYSLFIDFI